MPSRDPWRRCFETCSTGRRVDRKRREIAKGRGRRSSRPPHASSVSRSGALAGPSAARGSARRRRDRWWPDAHSASSSAGLVAEPHLDPPDVDAAAHEARGAGMAQDVRHDVGVAAEADLWPSPRSTRPGTCAPGFPRRGRAACPTAPARLPEPAWSAARSGCAPTLSARTWRGRCGCRSSAAERFAESRTPCPTRKIARCR